jgi:NTE family protein
MNIQVQPHVKVAQLHLPFEVVSLVLQGGGALGAYQAGIYEALAEHGIEPHWIAGMSIGAINAAIIAGNAPNDRIDRLREFWNLVTSDRCWPFSQARFGLAGGDIWRNFLNQVSAGFALTTGAKGFFAARPLLPWLAPAGTIEATSFYDTSALKHSLERLIDFDRLNAGTTRLSLGAVNVRTGNFVYFDTTKDAIRPEHIMASGALPPGFPAIEIDGEHYWESRTPRYSGSSTASLAETRSSSRWTSGARKATFPATCSTSPRGKRRFGIQAVRAQVPISSSRFKGCVVRRRLCWKSSRQS